MSWFSLWLWLGSSGSTLEQKDRILEETKDKLERRTNELYQANALSRSSIQEKEVAQRSCDIKQQEVDRLRGTLTVADRIMSCV